MCSRTAAALASTAVLIAILAGCSQPTGTIARAVRGRAVATATAAGAATEAVQAQGPAAQDITIGWVGDITPGSKYGMPPQHGRALFSAVRTMLSTPDIMVGNLEGTFGKGGPSKGSGPSTYSFQAPPANAESLAWAGFDIMNVANNHANDYLAAGRVSTRKALAANGISPVGAPDQIVMRTVKGIRVAFVGFAPYPWAASLADIPGARALVRQAKRKADVVVVVMHAGAEGAGKTHTPKGSESAYGEFRGNPRAFAHAVIDAGASAVVGSGPHVVRGIERYKGKLIAYSAGNFAGWGNFNRSGVLALSGLLTFRVDRAGDILGGRWRSIRLAGEGVPHSDGSAASLKLVRKLSAQDFPLTFKLGSDGRFAPAR